VQRELFHQDDRRHRDDGKDESRDEYPAEHFGDVHAGGAGMRRGYLDADAAAFWRHAEAGEQDGAHDRDVTAGVTSDNIRSQCTFPLMTLMYGPAARCKSLRRVGGERSCINVSGL
jgi:hypothetical protein